MPTPVPALLDALGFLDDGTPIERAIHRGVRAPDLGEAFYEGYQAALTSLLASEVRDRRASFCVTERGGGHPRAMEARLRATGDGFVLTGEKSFVTGADRAQLLFVVARTDDGSAERPELVVVRVPVDTAGVGLAPLPTTPFAPGIAHARVAFEDVRLPSSARLEGDGYARYVKPFRTVEDLHVVGAIEACLARIAAEAGDETRVERLLAMIAAIARLASADPRAASTHRAVAGVLDLLQVSLVDLDTTLAAHPEPSTRAAITRDLPLLRVAEKVRRARLETARAAG